MSKLDLARDIIQREAHKYPAITGEDLYHTVTQFLQARGNPELTGTIALKIMAHTLSIAWASGVQIDEILDVRDVSEDNSRTED